MKIVVLDAYTLNPGDLSWKGYQFIGDIKIYERTRYEDIICRCWDAEIVFTNKTPLDQSILNKLKNLKYIGVLATGYDVVDINTAKKNGVVVTNVPGYGTSSVVQMTFALLLELCNNVQRHSDSVHMGKWHVSEDWCYWDYPLIELAGKTMGIIGLGAIGVDVAKVASAFGMQVIASDRMNKRLEKIEIVSIEQLFEYSDVVSIHCPLTANTRGLVNKRMLRLMKNTSYLLNTSRGPIINEYDLANALDNGIIAGAGLDVLSIEPPSVNNPLFTAKNCIITPHIAWATRESRKRLINTALQNLISFINGKEVNKIN